MADIPPFHTYIVLNPVAIKMHQINSMSNTKLIKTPRLSIYGAGLDNKKIKSDVDIKLGY